MLPVPDAPARSRCAGQADTPKTTLPGRTHWDKGTHNVRKVISPRPENGRKANRGTGQRGISIRKLTRMYARLTALTHSVESGNIAIIDPNNRKLTVITARLKIINGG